LVHGAVLSNVNISLDFSPLSLLIVLMLAEFARWRRRPSTTLDRSPAGAIARPNRPAPQHELPMVTSNTDNRAGPMIHRRFPKRLDRGQGRASTGSDRPVSHGPEIPTSILWTIPAFRSTSTASGRKGRSAFRSLRFGHGSKGSECSACYSLIPSETGQEAGIGGEIEPCQ
jgi:hypothetical protein